MRVSKTPDKYTHTQMDHLVDKDEGNKTFFSILLLKGNVGKALNYTKPRGS